MRPTEKPACTASRHQARPDQASSCPACLGSRFVCEEHPRRSWPFECGCAGGYPCPVCNLSVPPEIPDDIIWEEDCDGSFHDTGI